MCVNDLEGTPAVCLSCTRDDCWDDRAGDRSGRHAHIEGACRASSGVRLHLRVTRDSWRVNFLRQRFSTSMTSASSRREEGHSANTAFSPHYSRVTFSEIWKNCVHKHTFSLIFYSMFAGFYIRAAWRCCKHSCSGISGSVNLEHYWK